MAVKDIPTLRATLSHVPGVSPPPQPYLCPERAARRAPGIAPRSPPPQLAPGRGPRSPRPGQWVPKGRANKRHTPRPWLVQRQGLAGAREGGAGQRQEKGSAGAGAAGGLREPCPAGCALPAALPTVALPLSGSGSVLVPSPAHAQDPPCSSLRPTHPLRLARAGLGEIAGGFGVAGTPAGHCAPGTGHSPRSHRGWQRTWVIQ